MENKKLAILGAGGHAKVVADIAILSGWDSVDFYDDINPEGYHVGADWFLKGDLKKLVLEIKKEKYIGVFVAIGNSKIRSEKNNLLKDAGANLPNIIHPKSIISPLSTIGIGCVFVAGSIVNPFSIIGDGCIVNTGATVGHDCVVGDYSHISPGANVAGTVSIGSNTWIGVGSAVRQNINIGSNVMIGAGSVVVSDIKDNVTAFGSPAREVAKK
ncbi:MAG: acetyltransferase [Halomonas sp.]|nr:acetyltransferase [Halomonas sp.]